MTSHHAALNVGQRPPLRIEDRDGMQNRRSSFEYEDLLACARGELFGSGNAQLPLPPMPVSYTHLTLPTKRIV